jgi:hypothetical protein
MLFSKYARRDLEHAEGHIRVDSGLVFAYYRQPALGYERKVVLALGPQSLGEGVYSYPRFLFRELRIV